MEIENKLLEILVELDYDKISSKEAQRQILLLFSVSGALPKPTREDYLELANNILEENITPRRISILIDKFKERFDWRRQ